MKLTKLLEGQECCGSVANVEKLYHKNHAYLSCGICKRAWNIYKAEIPDLYNFEVLRADVEFVGPTTGKLMR